MTPTDGATDPAGGLLRALLEARALDLRVEWTDAAGEMRAGRGRGTVLARGGGSGSVVVEESGRWEPHPGEPLRFRAAYRWEHLGPDEVAVAHLRRGPDRPVPLVVLVRDGDDRWESPEPHRCGDDLYRARVRAYQDRLEVRWDVRGPTKHQTLTTTYQP